MGPQGWRGEPWGALDRIIADVRESVVFVHVEFGDGDNRSGTGFYVDSKGTVLTATHVLEKETQKVREIAIYVGLDAGGDWDTANWYEVKAKLGSDMALLAPVYDEVRSQPLEIAETVSQADFVFTAGYPANAIDDHALLFTWGTVAALAIGEVTWYGELRSKEDHYIIADLPTASGSSGGPVFDKDGMVVGFVRGSSTNNPFNYVVNITGMTFP